MEDLAIQPNMTAMFMGAGYIGGSWLFLNAVFGRRWHRVAPGYPAINVWANEDGFVLTAELPGVKPDDIDISVVGETLTLSGTRQPDELQVRSLQKYPGSGFL